MAKLFQRFWNFMTGWLYQKQSDLEATNPGVVFDQALRDQKQNYRKMEEAVSGLVFNRNRLTEDIGESRKELEEVQRMLHQAVKDAQSDNRAVSEEAVVIGATLQDREEELLLRIAQLTESRDSANTRVEEYQNKLIQFQARIKKLEEEKSHAVAQSQVDKETIRINRELTGMSVDDDNAALNDLRNRLGRLHAQAMMTDEMRGKSFEEKIQQYKLKARSGMAQDRFLERVEAAKALSAGKSDTAEKKPLPS